MFVLTVISRHKRLFAAERIAFTALGLMLIIAVLTPSITLLFACPAWLGGSILIGIAGSAYRRWLRARRGGDTRLLVTRDGISFLSSTGPRRLRPWKRFRRVRFRHHLWWLGALGNRISRRLPADAKTIWRLRLRPRGVMVSQASLINVSGNWSRREASLVRNTLRRRQRGRR